MKDPVDRPVEETAAPGQAFSVVEEYEWATDPRNPAYRTAQAFAVLEAALAHQQAPYVDLAPDPSAPLPDIIQHRLVALIASAVESRRLSDARSQVSRPALHPPHEYDATAVGIIHRRRAGHRPADLEAIEFAVYSAEPDFVTVCTRKHDAHWRDARAEYLLQLLP